MEVVLEALLDAIAKEAPGHTEEGEGRYWIAEHDLRADTPPEPPAVGRVPRQSAWLRCEHGLNMRGGHR